MSKRTTVGEEAYKLMQKDDSYEAGEIMQEALKEYVDNLIDCAKKHEKEYEEDIFYICVMTKKERLLHNVIRNLFFARRTRPTPQYDMACYEYDKKDEKLTFLWAVPDKETVEDLGTVPVTSLPLDLIELAEYCRKFLNNTLV